MRKITLLLFGLICLASSTAMAQTQFHDLEKQWAKIIVARDKAAMEDLFSDNLIYTHSSGVVENKQEYIANVMNGKWGYHALDFKEVTVRQEGKTAWVFCGNATVVVKNAEGVETTLKLRTLHVYTKEKGKYRLIAHQATRQPAM
jgi:ketosteroid isomerase-like protein